MFCLSVGFKIFFFGNNQINTSEKIIKSMNILCSSFVSFLCFMERVVVEGAPTIMDSMCVGCCCSVCVCPQVKADKIKSNAEQEAVRIKANANEEAEKLIADSNTQAERVYLLCLCLYLCPSVPCRLDPIMMMKKFL